MSTGTQRCLDNWFCHVKHFKISLKGFNGRNLAHIVKQPIVLIIVFGIKTASSENSIIDDSPKIYILPKYV